MRTILAKTFAPILSLLTIMLGVSFFNTFMSVRVSSDGWSNFMTGLVYSAYYAGMMLGAIYIERVIKRTGHIRAFALFAAITACSIILQSFTLSPIPWLLFRFITGVCCAGLFIVIESWLLLLSSTNTRGVVLSIYMIAIYTGQSLGQFLLNFFTISSILPFNFTVVFCTLSIIPVCFMRASAPTISDTEYVNIFYLFRKVPFGFLGNLVSGLILSSFYALGPVFAGDLGLSLFQISLVMSVTIFGGMALQWPIGLFSDLFPRKTMLIITSLILMSFCLVLFLVPHMPFPLLLVILFFYGGFSFTLYPISISYCCDFFPSSGIISITSAALIIYGIGCIAGPLLSPLVMEVTSASGLFLYSAILSLLLALYGLRKQPNPSEPSENKEPFQPFPSTSTRIGEFEQPT